MKIIELKNNWKVKNPGRVIDIPAKVPGCVHTDLLAAKIIEKPFFRDNERKLQWIENENWLYCTTFRVSPELLKNERVILRFNGLDTLATITLNGKKLAKTDNMFRIFEFEVKGLLKKGQNRLEILFTSTLPYLRKENKAAGYGSFPVMDYERVSQGLLRKMQSNYGWDWGPRLATCGLWRKVELIAFSTARLKELLILQEHQKNSVNLKIKLILDIENLYTFRTVIAVSYRGKMVAALNQEVNTGVKELEINIRNPEIWWPNNLGAQPLYEVEVKLYDEKNRLLDNKKKRIGLRELTVIREKDANGESFYFRVNKVPFFVKGANWITPEPFPSAVTYNTYKKLLLDAKAANMNMLRVWGGGVYEHDEFYDLCDELGICVWQDFMAACLPVPVYKTEFIESFCKEAEDNIKRLRHHPSLALWCGNNELEQGHSANGAEKGKMRWKDYIELFDIGLHNVVKLNDPERLYWPGSPHSPSGERAAHANPKYGDSHVWNVWHGGATFEYYLSCRHRFVSEFGFQSFPELATVESYTLPKDRDIESGIMKHHQRCGAGNNLILDFINRYFKPAKDFEALLTLSQIMQSMGIDSGVEHFRRIMPVCMGTLFWQLNDCWPVASWSSIDYYGRWKALNYAAKRFFAPLLVSGVYEDRTKTVRIYAVNDQKNKARAKISWALCSLDGVKLLTGSKTVSLLPGASVAAKVLNVKYLVKKFSKNNLVLFITLACEKEPVSENIVLFAKPKDINLERPEILCTAKKIGKETAVINLTTDKPALWIRLKTKNPDIRFSDNFFHLEPGKIKVITAKLNGLLFEDFKRHLKVSGLTDTY